MYFWESKFVKSAYKLKSIEYFEDHTVTPVIAKNEPVAKSLEVIQKVQYSGRGKRFNEKSDEK